jgi:hypothetical protein
MNENDGATQLAKIVVSLPDGRAKTLAELVDGWREHVARLRDESRSGTAIGPLTWGAHDYLAALNLRSLVSQSVEQIPSEAQQRAKALVCSSDEILMSFTQPDINGWIERFAGDRHAELEWWWKRIPLSGPVRDEILRVVEGQFAVDLCN